MKTISPELNLTEIDKKISKYWKEISAFKKSAERRRDNQQYLFYDGPPFASGSPHYGHLLAGTIKDIIPRYQTMLGKYVERRFGWDTHGLPVEMILEKELKLNGRTDILEYGVAKFNEACRSGVMRCVDEWRVVVERLGRWIDLENDYKTMDVAFMESVWWIFKQLWDKDRIYLGKRVMPFSWRLSTPLSNFEASSNYKDVQDPAVTIRFKLKDWEGVSALAWTTTPWSLPSNIALCAGADIDYVLIEANSEKLILAEARLNAYFKKQDDYKIIEKFKGTKLKGLSYEPLFDFYIDQAPKNCFTIVNDDYVTIEDGTGLVHQSPAHGEDDFRIAKLNNFPIFDPIDAEGNFNSEVPFVKGKNLKIADKDIISDLKDKGLLYKHDTLMHSYPFCERSDTPLIYKAISAWYVKVEDLRDEMLKNNQTITWVPEHIKDGRFGNWLAQARDWNISRNRFWGNPLPIWICNECNNTECIGSKKELEEKSGQTVKDLHKHFVDEISWSCSKCKGTMQRTPEVLDCWFESGAMPYAQVHYPFENKESFDAAFPADFIAEGLDQTRGWFYTLLILGTTLFKKAPFKNVIVNGMILAEDGKKMSKRLKNYPDPLQVIDSYGADALRLYLVNSPAVKGESLRFSENGVKEIVRSVLIPYWNVYSFFTTYANVDKYVPSKNLTSSDNLLDRWIISRLQTLLAGIENEMSAYKLYAVLPVLLEFIEEVTNWYVRRSRRRFWSDDSQDKQNGYDTLHYVLLEFTKALAPFLPFVTEEIYQNLKTLQSNSLESIHFADYPKANKELINNKLESQMALIQKAVGLGRSLRARLNIRTRQPLAAITVVTINEEDRETLQMFEEHIKFELNVKSVLFDSKEENLVDATIKPNFPVLGPIVGKQMGQVSQALSKLDRTSVNLIESGKSIEVLGFNLNSEHLQIIRKAKSTDLEIETAAGVTVYYDLNISTQLLEEGLAREFVNRIQKLRKDSGLEVSDRIELQFSCKDTLKNAILNFADYIQSEVLGTKLTYSDSIDSSWHKEETTIENDTILFALKKVN
jgi:isoleucyl-tRNA synthetase